MLNPLALPQAVADSLAVLPELVRNARRANDQMAQMIERADRVIEHADRLMERFDAVDGTVANLVERGDSLVAMGEQATAEAAAVRETLERAIPAAQELSRQSGPILEMSAHARDQLADVTAELAKANVQMARVIELSGPLEKAGDRLERVVGRLRRDPGEPPVGPA